MQCGGKPKLSGHSVRTRFDSIRSLSYFAEHPRAVSWDATTLTLPPHHSGISPHLPWSRTTKVPVHYHPVAFWLNLVGNGVSPNTVQGLDHGFGHRSHKLPACGP